MNTIEQLTKEKEHYVSAWSDACNENQCLRNDLEKLRAYHFEQNERMCAEAKALRDALRSVVKAMLPANATPTILRGFGEPWPEVANALWPETHNVFYPNPASSAANGRDDA